MSERASLGAEPIRRLTEIVTDQANTNRNRALECLRTLDRLPTDDLARDDFRAAAQTFALLALADEITWESDWWRRGRG